MTKTCGIDCSKGRSLGCKTYCCRLLVRLAPEERVPNADGGPEKGFVDKDKDGYCIHFNRESFLCAIWHNRPKTCREYDCNNDFLLQVAVRTTFRTVVDLVKAAATAYIPHEQFVRVPPSDDIKP